MSTSFYPDRQKLREQYSALLPSYMAALETFQARLRTELSRIDVHFTMKYRVKTFASYYSKLLKRKTDEKKTGEAIPIHDIMGTRVVCPFLGDVTHVEECLRAAFKVHEIERKGAERTFREFGYESIHLLLEIPENIRAQFPDLDLKIAEVQIRTFLQDAWAEVEHELIYKNSNYITPLDEPLRRKLAALNANLSLSDDIFQEIRDYQRRLHFELNKRRQSFTAQLDEIKPGLTVADPQMPEDMAIVRCADCGEENNASAGISSGAGNSADSSNSTGSGGINGSMNGGMNGGIHEADSGNKDHLLLSALNAHNEKNFPLAISVYSKILEQEVQPYIITLVLIHRGKAYFAQSNYCEALRDFQAAAECSPTDNRAFYHLGIVNRVLDDNHAAIVALQKCLEINPHHIDALFALAGVYFDMRDYPGALEYCEKALLVEPESTTVKEFRKLVISRMKL